MMSQCATVELVSNVEEVSSVQQPARRESALAQRDEADLEWFWCFGESTFERSTFGSVLERQSLYGEIAELCLNCDGYGTDPASVDRCRPCRGKGRITIGRVGMKDPDVGGSRSCGECRGPTGKPRRGVVLADCLACEGTGIVESQAVGVPGAESGEGGYEPDDGALRRYAKVSRRLTRLEGSDRQSAAVLQAYYGVDGLRWGGTDHGRLTAVLPLTRAGARLIDGESNELGLGVRELFANVIADHVRKKTPGRASALMAATTEAGKLYVSACRAWNLTAVAPA
jgi:hypothetical protein